MCAIANETEMRFHTWRIVIQVDTNRDAVYRAEYIYRYFIMAAGGALVAYDRGELRKELADLVSHAGS